MIEAEFNLLCRGRESRFMIRPSFCHLSCDFLIDKATETVGAEFGFFIPCFFCMLARLIVACVRVTCGPGASAGARARADGFCDILIRARVMDDERATWNWAHHVRV